MEKVIVSGYGESEYGLFLRVKDKVAKSTMLRAGATKNGVISIEKGFTLDEVKAAYPFGSVIEGASWGKQITASASGVELNNVFEIEGI